MHPSTRCRWSDAGIRVGTYINGAEQIPETDPPTCAQFSVNKKPESRREGNTFTTNGTGAIRQPYTENTVLAPITRHLQTHLSAQKP